MHAAIRVVTALEQFKGLFEEQPQTRLSAADAWKLCGLEPHICDQLLAALVDVRFLVKESDGVYRRRPTPSIKDSSLYQ
jgi:hypothetical protein